MYALEILKKFEMEHCIIVDTPVEPRLKLSKNEDEQYVNPTQYRMLIRLLQYLCNTRPNLAYNVGIASKFNERLKVSHLAAVKRILRYVKGSIGCGILFPATENHKSAIYSDIPIPIGGEIRMVESQQLDTFFIIGETQISWCSKKESVVALPSCGIEYIAASLCVCQAVWLMNMLKKLLCEKGDAVTLLVDNVSEINLAKNLIARGRNKHIEMRFHYLRELLSEGRLRFGYCRSEDQVTDLLTKGVSIEVFKRLKKDMSMEDLVHLK